MKRWLVAVSLALAAGLASPAMAAQSATLVLRSGERIGGELVDMGASGLTFRVGGQNRTFPVSQVAVIDFVGGGTSFPASELDQVGDGGVVTTGGQLIQGRLSDVGGSVPLRITISLSAGGSHDYRSTELIRIYLSRPPAATTLPATPETPTSMGLRVPANSSWIDTGITVRRGDRVTFKASGEVRLSSNPGDVATPDGSKSGRRGVGPMPQTLAGALIGRIGPGTLFGIGTQSFPLPMPADGRLYLAVNDDVISDNQGEFSVNVTPSRR